MAKEKAKHDGLLCFLLAVIVLLILVIGGGAYYFLVLDNGEEIAENNLGSKLENNSMIEEEKVDNVKEELDINNELVKELHLFIPTVRYNNFIPTAYQTSKITFNDLQNQVKLINVFNHIDFNTEAVEIIYGEEGNIVPESWFNFSDEIINRNVKKIYGEDAIIKNEHFDVYFGNSCRYENGTYHHSSGGAGPSLEPISQIVKAEKQNDTICIYDKYLVVREVDEINNLVGDEYYIYNTTVSEPIDKIIDEKICEFDNEEFEKFFLDKYKNYMAEYKHMFKKNANGDYYWYSTEPVNIKTNKEGSIITQYNTVDTVKHLYSKHLKEKNDINEEKILTFEVDEVNIVEGKERIELINNLYPEAKETDIFAVIVYSVMPHDVNKTNWISGNGTVEGRWIKNKSACVHLVKENGEYKIKSEGTGW